MVSRCARFITLVAMVAVIGCAVGSIGFQADASSSGFTASIVKHGGKRKCHKVPSTHSYNGYIKGNTTLPDGSLLSENIPPPRPGYYWIIDSISIGPIGSATAGIPSASVIKNSRVVSDSGINPPGSTAGETAFFDYSRGLYYRPNETLTLVAEKSVTDTPFDIEYTLHSMFEKNG